jgi:hypothetical protein
MKQKSLVIAAVAAMLALMATIALVPQAYSSILDPAQNVTNGGIEEDDDTTNISSTPTKVSQKRSKL